MTARLSNLTRAARRAAAFTMIEIAISIGVIGFALVAIIGILPLGLNVQRDNREVTLINFDANYLMNAIRSGARGQDELTNYIVCITNYMTPFNAAGPTGRTHVFSYTNGQYNLDGNIVSSPFLTNGFNIIGLLGLPKYTIIGGVNFSNYVTADFRGISGSLVDQGASQASRDFAFTYRVYPEIIPSSASPFTNGNWVNFMVAGGAAGNRVGDPAGDASPNENLARNLQYNLNDIRLNFRWPVLPGGQVGMGREVFRSAVSGTNFMTNLIVSTGQVRLYFIQPLSYSPAQ